MTYRIDFKVGKDFLPLQSGFASPTAARSFLSGFRKRNKKTVKGVSFRVVRVVRKAARKVRKKIRRKSRKIKRVSRKPKRRKVLRKPRKRKVKRKTKKRRR